MDFVCVCVAHRRMLDTLCLCLGNSLNVADGGNFSLIILLQMASSS